MDDTRNDVRELQQCVLALALAELGLRVPVDAGDQAAQAIERAREIDRQVRAGLGSPFDTGEGRLPVIKREGQFADAVAAIGILPIEEYLPTIVSGWASPEWSRLADAISPGSDDAVRERDVARGLPSGPS